MEMSLFEIRELAAADISRIVASDGGAAWNGGFKKWTQRLAEHEAEQRIVLLAVDNDAFVGYGSLLWSSSYAPFRDERIPEIQDLVVSEPWRNRGIATSLIRALEDRARARGHKQIGLGVGLYADYGPAQRLYMKLGYRLDGRGVTYNCALVSGGATVRLDDDLILWMVKAL
jgi:GNAT superfamily N-acetyltransferase